MIIINDNNNIEIIKVCNFSMLYVLKAIYGLILQEMYQKFQPLPIQLYFLLNSQYLEYTMMNKVIQTSMHKIHYYELCTIITTDNNFILTPTADSGFVLNFQFICWIVSWIPKYLIHFLWFVNKFLNNYSNFIYYSIVAGDKVVLKNANNCCVVWWMHSSLII